MSKLRGAILEENLQAYILFEKLLPSLLLFKGRKMSLEEYLKYAYNQWHTKYEKDKDLEYYAPGEIPESEGFEIHDCIKEDYDGNLMFGHHITPYSFILKSKFSIEDHTKLWQEKRYDLSALDREAAIKMAEMQWIKFDKWEFEKFQEDRELIYEGVIERLEYHDDNSLKTRQILDQDTGELMYQATFEKGQYTDPDTGKEFSYLQKYTLYKMGNTLEAERTKTKKGLTRWEIVYPLHMAGKYMEDLYLATYKPYKHGKRYGKSTKRNHSRKQ